MSAQHDEPGAWEVWGHSVVVGGMLLLLLAATILIAYARLGIFNAVASFGIAAVKAGLVALIFMKLRRAPALLILAAVSGLYALATLFSLTFTDYPLRNPVSPPAALGSILREP